MGIVLPASTTANAVVGTRVVVVAPERRRRVSDDGANAARKIVVIFALEFVVPHKVG